MTGDQTPDKLNILFLICDMQGGGAQRVASILCNEWVKRGDAVTLVTYEPRDKEPFYKLNDSIDLIRLNLQTNSRNYFKALVFNTRRILQVSRLIKDRKPDVVLCFGYDVSVIGVLSSLGLHNNVIACERSDPAVYPEGGIWRKLRDFAYPKATKIVAQTPSAADFCKRFGNDVYIIPNPVSAPEITGEADITAPDKPFIASMGRMSEEKGHDVLINAFAGIADSHKDLDLLLIGDGVKRGEYEQMAADLGLKDRIHFTGRSKNPFPVLAKAKAFILPSRFEGFPNALAEAMTLGLPCISTLSAIGARALIDQGRNGILVESDNPEDMGKAIARFLDDRGFADKLGGEAKKMSEVLSLENNLKLWDRVMRP